jgi:bacterioferritin (cytochrome b1)
MNTETIVKVLNGLLESELAAVEYYRIHAEAISEEEIADGVRGILPAEQGHAVNLAKRIRELGGVVVEPGGPATKRGQEMGKKSKEQGTLGMLRLQLQEEQQAIIDYARQVAEIEDDMVTLEMLEEQLLDEMRHAKWLKRKIMELEGK